MCVGLTTIMQVTQKQIFFIVTCMLALGLSGALKSSIISYCSHLQSRLHSTRDGHRQSQKSVSFITTMLKEFHRPTYSL